MGKNKLARWNELDTFVNVIQTDIGKVRISDHPVKGRWRQQLFRNDNPLVMELGCGRGEYTIGLAEKFPGKNFIGVDIKGARLWRGARTSKERNIANAAFLRTRIEFIGSYLADDEADEIWITFPDPHPGLRHASKRLTSPHFLNIYRSLLRNGGLVHLKTDNLELHRYTMSVVQGNNLELLTATEDLYSGYAGSDTVTEDILSIRTHYEKIFLEKGMPITYLCFRLEKGKYIEDQYQRKGIR